MGIDAMYPNYIDPTVNQINIDGTKSSVDAYVSKLTEQVERGELDEATLTLKEAAANTREAPIVFFEKFWVEPTQINLIQRSSWCMFLATDPDFAIEALNRIQRGSWCMLLAKDPDFAKDSKILLANAIREFNSALKQPFEITEKKSYVDACEKLIRSCLEFIPLEILDGNLKDAKACYAIACDNYSNLKRQEPRATYLSDLNKKLWTAKSHIDAKVCLTMMQRYV